MTPPDFPDPTDDDAPDAPPSNAPHPNAPADKPALRAVTTADTELPPWARGLAWNSKMTQPTKEAGNVAMILSRSACFLPTEAPPSFRYDAFADRVFVGALPALPRLPDGYPETLAPPQPSELSDEHVTYLGLWLRRQWFQSFTDKAIRAGIIYAARQHAFHPLREYLEQCRADWDGAPRVERWVLDYLGAMFESPAQAVYLCAIGRMWLVSAIARAFAPGCKVDHILILEGPQGVGKTRALETMFSPWFLPDLPDLDNKDAMHLLAGSWCVCSDELNAMQRAAQTKFKSFLTRTEDVYRAPYAANGCRRPRGCVFAATTNDPDHNTDATGARRNWSVLCGAIDIDALARDRAQLFGEAVDMYRRGVPWWPSSDLIGAISDEQERRYQRDEWEPRISAWGRKQLTPFSISDVLTGSLGLEPADWTPGAQQRVARCLRRLGAERSRAGRDAPRLWSLPTASDPSSE